VQVSLHGARASRTRTRHRVPLVHASYNPSETFQVTSEISIGITSCSKDSFLKPSYVLLGRIPLDNFPICHTPFGLFNGFTHRLTSPSVKISQYVSFVETCLGSLHPFRSGISVVRSRLQPYSRHYSMTFAFSSILCPLNRPPSSQSGYHSIVNGIYWVYQVPHVRRSIEPLGRHFSPVALRMIKE